MKAGQIVGPYCSFFIFISLLAFSGNTALAERDPVLTVAKSGSMQYALEQKRKKDPSIDISVRVYKQALYHTRSPAQAKAIAIASLQYGRRIQKLYQSGISFEQRQKSAEEAASEYFGQLITIGEAVAKDPRAKVALFAIEQLNDAWARHAKRKPNLDPNHLSRMRYDPEYAKRYAEEQLRSGLNYERTGRIFRQLTAAEFNQMYNGLSEEAQYYFEGFIDQMTDYTDASSIKELAEENPGWAHRMNGKDMLGLLQKMQAQLEELNRTSTSQSRRMAILQAQVKETRKIVEALTADFSSNIKTMKESNKAIQAKLTALEDAIAKKLSQDEIDRRARELEAELQLAKEKQQKITNEKLGLFDSTSNFLTQFGILTNNADVQKVTGMLSNFSQIGKRFYELSMITPVSGFGQISLTMDYISLGMQLANVAFGLGGSSPDKAILEAIQKLSEMVTDRFNQLDRDLGMYHGIVMRNLEEVKVAIYDLRRDAKNARYRLIGLQASLNELAYNLAQTRDEIKDLRKDELWQNLFQLESKHITRRKTPHTATQLGNGLSNFAHFGVSQSKSVAFLESATAAYNVKSLTGAQSLLKSHPDPYESIDFLLRLGDRFFDLSAPKDNRIANASFWRYASDAYIELLKRNQETYLHSMDAKKDLKELISVGESVKDAMVEGRKTERTTKVLDRAQSLYQRNLNSVLTQWRSVDNNILLRLPSGTKGLNKIFSPTKAKPTRTHSPIAAQKAALLKRFPIHSLDKGGLSVSFDGQGPITNARSGWEFVPPALRALLHVYLQSAPYRQDVLPAASISIHVERISWIFRKTKQRCFPGSYFNPYCVIWFSPTPTFKLTISSRLVRGTQEYRMNIPSIIKPFKRSVRFKLKDFNDRNKRMRRLVNEQVVVADKEYHQEAINALRDSWDTVVAEHLKRRPIPFYLVNDSVTIKALADRVKKVKTALFNELETIVSNPPEKLRLKQLHLVPSEYGEKLSQSVEEMDATKNFLYRNLAVFAPDYLISIGTLKDSKKLDKSLPSRLLLLEAIKHLYTASNTDKPYHLTLKQIVTSSGILGLGKTYGLGKKSDFESDYLKYMKRATQANPQCSAVENMLSKLQKALEQNKTYQKQMVRTEKLLKVN